MLVPFGRGERRPLREDRLLTPRFYVGPVAALPEPARAEGTVVALPAAAAHHATRVLRLGQGDEVVLFDGGGGEYLARLGAPGKRGVDAILQRYDAVEREAPGAVTLVLSLIAADAMDNALRKAVELGVARIEPVIAARSQHPGASRLAQRLAHWRQVAIGACEQCGRNRVPEVAAPLPLSQWMARAGDADIMLVPGAASPLAAALSEAPARALLVGPEGGFDDGELDAASRAGLRFARLGASILRADTAVVAALALALTLGG